MDDVVITIFEKISNLAAKAYEAYKHVKYFKKFSTEIYDRIEAGAHHFKYLQRHEKKIKEKFRDQDSITNLQRYVIAVTSLTNLLVEFSELHQLKKYLNSLNYKDKIIEKIKRYDETIRDLNLEVSLENLESVENLYLLVEEGFNDVSQTMVSMKNNMDNLGNNMEFLMEMVAGVNKSIKELSKKSDQSDFKKNEFSDKVFDGYKLTDPPSGEDSRRGKVFKKLFNRVQPVASWHKKLESRPNMPDILKILEKLYKKHYFTRSKSYCENTTYGSLDDDDFDFNVTNEFIKSDTCELDFKEIGTST
ncbi:676_t:CDS:2 [Entrophospora sp. SA101]|nr:676_t:CDS:2 [Entrophospora sp. SA101]